MPENETAPGMTRVRVTMWPDRDHEVAVDEVPVLRHQGLLIEDGKPETPAAAPAARPTLPKAGA